MLNVVHQWSIRNGLGVCFLHQLLICISAAEQIVKLKSLLPQDEPEYIDKDDEQNLASDLYIDKNTHHTKLKWKNNGGIGWTIGPDDNKWHGFKPMKYEGVRRILIVNWVKDEVWKDKSQLYLDWRTKPFKYNPNDWDKLDNFERNHGSS